MMQPNFKAWYKRSIHFGRTTLVIAFKVLILTESGQLEVPQNCASADADLARSKAVANSAIKDMAAKKYP
eukprot:3767073-Pleurochrysis_carterae.AAC.1